MSSQTLFALHAIANVLITLFAVGLFWHAWKTDQKSRKIFFKIQSKNLMDRVLGGIHHAESFSGKDQEFDLSGIKNQLRNRILYGEYLQNLDGDDPMTFPEWLENRKEAHHG